MPLGAPAVRGADGTVTVARWFGAPERPLLGWLTAPAAGVTAAGVLVLAPIGYEWWSAHRTVRTIAERLAVAGHTVLRVDYDGTGDSAGAATDPGRVAAWRASAAAGAAQLRALGCTGLVVVGVRVGGLLALVDGAALGADAVVTWAAPASGKRAVRELRLLGEPPPEAEGATVVAGTVFTAATLADLTALGSGAAAGERLRASGVAVTDVAFEDGASALAVPAEDAVVPEAAVGAVLAAVGAPGAATGGGGTAVGAGPSLGSATTAVPVAEGARERVVDVGGLVGVRSDPAAGRADALVVWLNCGSEPHVGSGRAWTEYARALAARGHASLRLDFSGWGESPDRGHAPGRPYDAHTVGETVATVRRLRQAGEARVVLAGLCAGAWVALRAVLEEPVEGVFALNPQLYWRPGDPVEALMRDTRVRRTAERERDQRLARRGVWTALDVLGRRPWTAAWLDRLAATGVPVALTFAAGDDGLEHLHDRARRRLSRVTRDGRVRVIELPEIDHSMHRAWLRDRVVDAADAFVRST